MRVVRLEMSLEAEAEQAIARVWRELEAHHIATPRMAVTRSSGITVDLTFASPDEAEVIADALRGATCGIVKRERVA